MSINDIVFYFHTVAYLWEIDITTVINITLSLNTFEEHFRDLWNFFHYIFSIVSLDKIIGQKEWNHHT